MKKNILLPFLILFVCFTNAQVGLDTNDPKTTFHIVGSATDAAAADGILLPTMSITQLEAKMGATTYGADQDGALVYIDDVSSASTLVSTSAITKKGIYYYDHTVGNWLAVGESKLWSTTGNTGTDETTDFIGTTDTQALMFKVNNTFAGRISDGADGSLFLGYRAGESDDLSGNQNTFLGYEAGRETGAINSGFYNTAVGFQALLNNTAGGNTAVGRRALASNTGGSSNVAFGSSALADNIDGTDNIAIGSSALGDNIDGDMNIAIGNSALRESNGNFNTAVGHQTLRLSTGGSNTAIGFRALEKNTTGNLNTALGVQTLKENTAGASNTAIGYVSLQENTTGSNNTAIGGFALTINTTGSRNIALGRESLRQNTTGDNNLAYGYRSLSKYCQQQKHSYWLPVYVLR